MEVFIELLPTTNIFFKYKFHRENKTLLTVSSLIEEIPRLLWSVSPIALFINARWPWNFLNHDYVKLLVTW